MSRAAVGRLAALALLLLTGCAAPSRAPAEDDGGTLAAEGSAPIDSKDPSIKTDTQRRALARDVAAAKAKEELVSEVKGLELESGGTLGKATQTNANLDTLIQEMIDGAEMLKTEFTADNRCVVTLGLSRDRVERTLGLKLK